MGMGLISQTAYCSVNHISEILDIQTMIKELKKSPVIIPASLEGERFPTLNGMGYVFDKISPFVEKFIEEETRPGAHLFEVGAGFSVVALKCLERKVGHYTANDMSKEHLEILLQRILRQGGEVDSAASLPSRFTLWQAEAPFFGSSPKEEYNAILMDKVLHFLTPDKIQDMLAWSLSSLKEGGKIYVLTSSPYLPSFKKKILPLYSQNKIKGSPFPGFIQKPENYLDSQIAQKNPSYHLPEHMTFF